MNASIAEPVAVPRALAGKYLMVTLAGEPYGLAVLNVREIIRFQKITPVPEMSPWVKGVINLRGRVIPVLDLRLRLQLAAEFTDRSCIVVVQPTSAGSGVQRHLGLIVDEVEEVAQISADDIEPPPEFDAQTASGCVLGLAKARDQVKTLLDVERVFSGAGVSVTAD